MVHKKGMFQNGTPLSHLFLFQSIIAIHTSAKFLDVVACDVFVVLHHLIDDTVWSELDDAVRNGLNELVVVRSEKYITLVELQVVVERLDRFEVQVVGWSVENQAVRIAELHAGNHTTHLFTP